MRTNAVLYVSMVGLLCSMVWPALPAAAQTERRQRLASMSASELAALKAKKERFDNLSPQEQQRLRELHRQITNHADSQRLLQTMEHYNEWLATLSSSERRELQRMTPQERIERVRQLKKRYEEENLGRLATRRLSRDDARNVFQWLDERLKEIESRLLSLLDEGKRKWVARIDDEGRRRFVLLRIVFQEQGADVLPTLSDADIQRLLRRLSPEARRQVQQKDTSAERQRVIYQWIEAAMVSPWMPSREDLERFFAEKLDAKEREELERLPPDRMMEELRHRYLRYRMRSRDHRRGGGRWDPDRRRGDHRGPDHRGPPDGRGPGRGDFDGRGPDGSHGRSPRRPPPFSKFP